MVDAEDLLKVILVLVIIWIGLEILGEIVGFLFGPFSSILGLVVIVLIVLFLLDRI
ncbi:DUF7554 family protein [Halorarius litoreus]|uniref:DUF7554 family protein n=1 Tax=Halorarius litoreus TaxID=2962676 RepID=UPI0020CE5AAC|nr:hypothetical protein [Halorarius litoreus]